RSGTNTPAGRPIEVTVEAADGEAIAKLTPALGAFGTFSADVKVPETGRLGTYAINATVQGSPREYADATGDFEVAEYRPAEFKVSVQSDKPAYIRGDKASYTARGDYLFGAPMSNVDARISVTRSETTFSPPGFEGFATDDTAFFAAES